MDTQLGFRPCVRFARMKLNLIFCVAAAMAGCASAPKPAAPPAASSPPATAAEVNQRLVSQGYQATTYRGQLVYCRTEKVTGSQFSHKTCLSEADLELLQTKTQDEMNPRTLNSRCVMHEQC
jgi:hypothetical protein